MAPFLPPQLFVVGVAGLTGGCLIFARGLAGYRRAAVVSSIATSTSDSLAAGEVRLTGTIEPLAQTLVSALQSEPCVWYHSTVTEHDRNEVTILDEQRSVEFLLRDETGTVRIVPRGARWEVPLSFDASTSLLGGAPVDLRRRVGPASAAVPDSDREAAILELLTVHPVEHSDPNFGELGVRSLMGGGTRHYHEARLEVGQQITVIGHAVPYGDLDGDPGAIIEGFAVDEAIAADLHEAREAGLLADSAEEAWGNAAIPGFGIGRPVTPPHLDTGANSLPPADPRQAERADRLFDVPPETLVVARGPATPLIVYLGPPTEAVARDQWAFYRGLAGAGLATASAIALAAMINGGF